MAWLKITKLCPRLSYFPGFPCLKNVGENPTPKQSNGIFLVNFSKVQQQYKFLFKKTGYLDKKVRASLTADIVFQILAFWTVFWNKSDYNGVWMIKITIKTNDIDMDVCFFQKNMTYKNHVCSYNLAFYLTQPRWLCQVKECKTIWSKIC